MSERTPTSEQPFRVALRLICTARKTRLYVERHGPRVRRSLDQLADERSRLAMELVAQG